MTNRMISGKLAGGDYGMRVSIPGYDVFNEGFGSRNISFDTRVTEIGTVVASGLITCGGASISFPAMPYVPICKINRFDGADLFSANEYFRNATGGGASGHTWLPAVAVVTNSSIQVVPFIAGTFDPRSFYDPTGQSFLYSVLANGG